MLDGLMKNSSKNPFRGKGAYWMLDGWMENSSKNPLLGEVGILDTVYWMAGWKLFKKPPLGGRGHII